MTPTVLNTRDLTWTPDLKTLLAEASDLAAMNIPFRTEYLVESHITHNRTKFKFAKRVDKDGDTLHWEYTCPAVRGVKLVIFND